MTRSTPLETPIELTPKEPKDGCSLKITPRAFHKLASLCKEEKAKNPDASPYLQIKAQSGGCSGFQYDLTLALSYQKENIYFQASGVEVGIDPVSLELLTGSVIDYQEDLMSASFSLQNPNATAVCGCGNSFSIL